MASDILSAMKEESFFENSSDQRHEVPKDLASLKQATFFYPSGNEQVALKVANDRIALNTIGAVDRNPDLLAEWGLRPSRSVGGDFSVYESSSPLDDAFYGRLIGSGLVEKAVSVFRNADNGNEAVLLNEAIVSLKAGVTPENFFSNRSEFRGYRPLGGTPDQYVVTLAAGYGERALDAIQSLSSDPGLVWAAPNFYQAWQKFYLPNDPRFGNLWHLHNTGQSGGVEDADSDLPEAWDVIRPGSSTLVIGVVDDGVATNHPDLNPWVNLGEIPGNGLDDDGNGWVDDVNGWNFVNDNNVSVPTDPVDGHGTAVAGVAAARGDNSIGVTGASYNTRVLSARIFAGNSVASDAGIAEAIYYAAGRKRDGSGTWQAGDLSNHSWGGGAPSTAINDALTWATSQGRSGKGSLQVFAAGNSGVEVGYPATQATVNSGIAVIAAVNNFGNISEYSSIGLILDVAAPSNDFVAGTLAIDTTDRIGADGYSADDYTGTGDEGFGGTSSAAPLATGIMALAMARDQQLGLNLSPAQMRSLMRVNTDLLASEQYNMASGKSYKSGYGRINAASLLRGLGTREISVLSDKGEVTSGGTTYDVGEAYVGTSIDVTFRIRNQGSVALNLSDLSVDAGPFSIFQFPTDLILDLGESTTFSVRFLPTAESTVTRTVRITSNDSDEGIFSFDIRGIGLLPNVSGNVFEDWDGDGIGDFDDRPFTNHLVYLDSNRNGTWDETASSFTESPFAPIQDFQKTLSSISVSGFTQNVSDVNVTLNVTHSWLGDLAVTLIAPDGSRVALASRVGGSGDNFTNTTFDDEATTSIASGTAPFTGSFRPSDPLTVLDGTDPNGTWTLEIEDLASGDEGTLLDWTINIAQSEPFAQTSATGFFLFDNLEPGDYRLRTSVPSGFLYTSASFYDFTILQSSDFIPGLGFGFYKPNRFYGKVFDDFNADGQQFNEAGVVGRELLSADYAESSQTFTNSNSIPILDLATVTSTLTLNGIVGSIVDLNVILNITHTFDADLDVFLEAPNGTRVELFTDVGGGGDDFTNTVLDDAASQSINSGTAPFTGTFRPEGTLSSFNGLPPNGTWTLSITDDAGADVGTLLNWSLVALTSSGFKMTSDSMGRAFVDLPDGTHTFGLNIGGGVDWVYTLPSDGKRTVTVPATMFNQTYGIKKLPKVLVDSSAVTGAEGTTIQQTGTWSSPYGSGAVSLSASVGTVTKNANGTWVWSYDGLDDTAPTSVIITASDGFGGIATASFTYAVTNVNPNVTVGQANVSGNVLSTLTNTGTWNDVPADTVTLTASLGTVTKNSNGTWAWSLTPSQAYSNQTVTITATDEDGGSSQVDFKINALVAVTNTKVYYKGSSFAGSGVNAALDNSKVLAKPGAVAQALTFANLINTTRGINGLVFDVAGLAAANLTTSDFVFRMSPTGIFTESTNPPSSWAAAPAPLLIHVTAGTTTAPARVRLEWADNAIANRWLQIKVLANANTGLLAPQVYYIGHLAGETNGLIEGGAFRVRGTDVSPIVSAIDPAVTVPVDNILDLNKDGRIRGTDSSPAVTAVGRLLTRITIPTSGSDNEGEGGDAKRVWIAAPGFEIPKPSTASDDSRRGDILARLTDELFSVFPAAVRESGVASSTFALAPMAMTAGTSDMSADLHLPNLDEYFDRLGRGPRSGGSRNR